MPFLDHLEELRWRILWSLGALVLASVIGFWLVQHFDVLALLKRPIAELLPEGKLFVTRPTDAFIITLKLAVLVGAVLASPVVLWQVWAFLSPALYEREKRFVIPILIAGLFLFVGGALMAYLWVLPTALKLLFSFQRPDLEFIITADAYFSFASLFMLAFGVVFETPLVIVLLAAFGVVHPNVFAKNRPIALVLGAIVAALLTPPDAVSMMLMLVPLMLLYELGILVARLLWRARRRELHAEAKTKTAALVALLALGAGARAEGQRLPPPRAAQDSLAADSLRRGQPVDTAAARKLGLPTAPSRQFPRADSLIQEMLKRAGFHATRYAGDTLTLFADTKEIVLNGSGLVEREGSTLEADSIRFFQAECRLQAMGDPKLFDQATVLVGEGMRYNTCERRGIVADAFTSFKQSGVEWFLRGQLAVDSASTRLYAGGSKITSSDLPLPDYHFAAGEIKWVSNTIMVARPAILYVRDVPVLWLPFIFQDMRQGRRSGLLVPGFGLNDLVRPNRGYRRQLTNLGYYFAFSDYVDAQASMDWYSGNSVQFNGRLRYHWLDRFVRGDLAVSRIYESGQGGGSRSLQLILNHNQQFNLRTRLNANINYVTSARVLERNSVDPNLATASLVSAANFSKQFHWGSLQLGGNRRQDLSSGVIQQTLPAMGLSPQPINLAPSVTWSPTFSLNSTQTQNQKGSVLALPPVDGVAQFETLRFSTRSTSMRLGTPLRIGSWNLPLDVTMDDQRDDQRRAPLRLPDPDNPGDTLTRFYAENFSTGVDWNTGISLPVLFASTWRLAPRVGIRNATSGAFVVRNQYTGGRWVSQGKRLDFGAGISPSLFGFFPGVGPLERIRHSISPSVSWQYAPAASVPEDYSRATDPAGTRPARRSDPVHSMTFGLSQIFEAKLKPPPGDTLAAQNPRKIKLLAIQTSGVSYDFERAKKDSLTGWTTQTLSNTFTSDLLPGFTLATSHDLWDGPVGTDGARFSPFLTSVSTRFSLSAATFSRLLAMLTGGAAPPMGPGPAAAPPPPSPGLPSPGGSILPGVRTTQDIAGGFGGGRGLTMSLGYDEQRQRGDTATAPAETLASGANRTLSVTTSFSPTRNWNLSWQTQYNFTTNEFGQHTLRLERDLRRWRATFDFLKSPNGNFAFSFHIVLLDQSDIKFNYDQRTVNR